MDPGLPAWAILWRTYGAGKTEICRPRRAALHEAKDLTPQGKTARLKGGRYEGNVTAEAAGLKAAALHEEKPEGKPHKTIQNQRQNRPPALHSFRVKKAALRLRSGQAATKVNLLRQGIGGRANHGTGCRAALRLPQGKKVHGAT